MKSRLIPALLVLASLTGCRFPAIAPQSPAEATRPDASQAAPALRGRVSFGLQAQVAVGDLVEAATVSLIDASSGRTVSTARTDASGQFVLTFEGGFTADPSATYYLEAVKGLANNQPGHSAVRLRTVIRYADGWTSISNAAPNQGIVVNAATTALSIGAGYLSGFDASHLIGKLAGTIYTPTGALSEDDYQALLGLVNEVLASDRDPLHRVGRSTSNAWMILDQRLTVSTSALQEVDRGQEIVLHGTGFLPEPGGQTVRFGELPAAIVEATPTTLKIRVPQIPWLTQGRIMVQQGQTLFMGPEYKNTPTAVPFAGKASLSGAPIGDNVPATEAVLGISAGGAFDPAGNFYFSEYSEYRVRKVRPDGVITTFAGTRFPGSSGDGGLATAAQLFLPSAVAADAAGNVYIGEDGGYRIRKVDAAGMISTVVGTGVQGSDGDGGQAKDAMISRPYGLIVDPQGNLYLADRDNHRVRVVGPDGVIRNFAGTGTAGYGGDGGLATSAQLNTPSGLAFDQWGNLYVADWGNSRVRKVAPNGIITTVAGGGASLEDGIPAAAARLPGVNGVAVDQAGTLFLSLAYGKKALVRQIDTEGTIRTLYQPTGNHAYDTTYPRVMGLALSPQGGLVFSPSFDIVVMQLR